MKDDDLDPFATKEVWDALLTSAFPSVGGLIIELLRNEPEDFLEILGPDSPLYKLFSEDLETWTNTYKIIVKTLLAGRFPGASDASAVVKKQLDDFFWTEYVREMGGNEELAMKAILESKGPKEALTRTPRLKMMFWTKGTPLEDKIQAEYINLFRRRHKKIIEERKGPGATGTSKVQAMRDKLSKLKAGTSPGGIAAATHYASEPTDDVPRPFTPVLSRTEPHEDNRTPGTSTKAAHSSPMVSHISPRGYASSHRSPARSVAPSSSLYASPSASASRHDARRYA